MHTVVETATFISEAKALRLSSGDRLAIVEWIAAHPLAGDLMEGTGGARKVRFATGTKGKRGGFRVITFYGGVDIPVFLLNIFSKNEKTDLSPSECRALKSVLSELGHAYRGRGRHI